MLTSLSIRDIVLIETLDLDFERGLGVLTGETGAGKSILLDALGLALGDRADSGLVRSGVGQASVTASFLPSPEARALLDNNDLLLGAGEELIVRRTVKADGGSRAFVNDQPVSAALLRELGGLLVEIHGQHDDRGLINPKGHRGLLDAFARSNTDEVAAAFQTMRSAEQALETAKAALADAERDLDWLEHAVTELRAFAPKPGEEAELADRRATMQRGQKIADELNQVNALIEDGDGGLSKLRQAARILDRIADDHPALAEALAAVDRAINEGSVAEDRLREGARALAYDPAALEEDEARLFDLRALARKHRVQPDQLADLTEELAARHEAIEAGSDGLSRLEATLAVARETYRKRATALNDQRIAAAAKLDAAVAQELAPLKLDSARFRTVVSPMPELQWGPHGMDRVEFEISTNPGAPFGPLVKIASGGELSRFILALKVALSEQGTAPTMIFDEIDRGVGGAVASAIGERLQRLAEGAQVVRSTTSNRGEKSHRMLSGAEVTDEACSRAKGREATALKAGQGRPPE
ncbi:MAG: DNA repair protein RecN [Sphingomonadales bacterium]|nr:DNA repair protein RecN [Sphingomonadales bacterium]